ncbi:MAG: RNA polymerase subunit sigma-70 [Acidobacteriia bacterium]|nr:RNA polymerase subunit sigma-70 [Terriglobia bacterium]
MDYAGNQDQRTEAAYGAIEQAVRDSYGRLLAFLAARSRDVAGAEDALADAFKTAVETWPRMGVPEKPEAWLLVAARRKQVDMARHARVRLEAAPHLRAAAEEAYQITENSMRFPDDRLKLLFVCAHPAIDVGARTPMMLQTVLGLDAARIASAFLVQPSAMGQRLTRAKAKIRASGLRFELPEAKELPERLDAVLEAIYAAYGSGWDDVAGADSRRKGLATEAISLGRLLVQLMPEEPEAKGLLALMLHCEARRNARRAEDGAYVPLLEQDVALWSKETMEEAERWLRDAWRAKQPGPFQFEAAIQSAHAQRASTGKTDWKVIALLYEGLVSLSPTIGARVGQAAAVSEAHGPEKGWIVLQAISPDQVANYQPYWALAAHLLAQMRRSPEAVAAYTRAIGLCEDHAMREFLRQRLQRLLESSSS